MKKVYTILILALISSSISIAQEVGQKIYASKGIEISTSQLMNIKTQTTSSKLIRRNFELVLQEPNRKNLPQAPGTKDLSQWPPAPLNKGNESQQILAPQTFGVNFLGAQYSDAYLFPPDCMGAAGPTQFIVFINGRLRSFNKTTGTADGVLDIDPDVFFSSILSSAGSGEVTFTSDPNIRYDRLSGKWFLTIIDVTQNTSSGAITKSNRLLFAISDGSIITGSTVWRFVYYQNTSDFDDYPSLGIDADAIYIGTNRFTVAGSFVNCRAYVWNKALLISGSSTGYIFDNLLTGSYAGPYSPRGVDNPDPLNTGSSAVGYFIGVDGATYGTLMMRRISDPGGIPSISENISISTTLSTSAPVKVPHLGNTGNNNGRLDALDDRLFVATIRNGRLWTSHNIGVNNAGTTTGFKTRNAARWYELTNLNSTPPTIVQSGTLYDNSGTSIDLNQRNYWIPSIAVSGQGHAVLGCSIAGSNEYVNALTTGRLSTDALGTLRDGPGGSSLPGYTSSSTAYNPSSDPGGTGGRRWGDYSFTCVDPNDDMTMWTIQEYCNASNSWGVRVVQLKAPLPVTPALSTPSAVAPDLASTNIVVTGTSMNGTGFFDTGSDVGGPGFANHITASITGGVVVNSITYNSPTQVTLNISTIGVADGYYNITITNPDGQSATGNNLLQIDHLLPVELSSFSASIVNSSVKLNWETATEVNNYGFDILRQANISTSLSVTGWEKIGFVNGNGNSNSTKNYSFEDKSVLSGKYSYKLKQIDNDGKYEYSKTVEVDLGIPNKFELSQNYPNPFNPNTTIKFSMPEAGNVKLTIYNILGQEVKTLVNEYKEAGVYTVNFDAENLNSGLYIYKLQVNDFTQTHKMTLIK
jgi:hypothetical protein